MRTISIILVKEFRQILRNRSMLPIIFVMPFVQLLILSNAASFEIKNIKLDVVDLDQSSASRLMVDKFAHNDHFTLVQSSFQEQAANRDFYSDRAKCILEIPRGFERDLVNESKAPVQLRINAIDGAAAGVIEVYAGALVQQTNLELIRQWAAFKPFDPPQTINVRYSFWFNPDMNYKTFMVPGILVMLVTMVGMFLAAMNIVREKEMGTIEQLNVTPIKKYQFIIGKLLPFVVLAMMVMSIGLLIGRLVYHIPMEGNILWIYAFALIYLMVVLGFGLLVSTLADTQQQAMFISWFFMVIFILMSGLFTPIESMPGWAQKITEFNPIAYFVAVTRMVMLKGSGFMEIRWMMLKLFGYGVLMLSLATWRYRKVNA